MEANLWDNIDGSMEEVNKVWARFDRVKEIAEQHDFPRILMADLQYKPLYDDLLVNYDERHAKMFIYGLTKILDELGYIGG